MATVELLGRVETVRRKMGLAPVTVEVLCSRSPALAKAEAALPGLLETILAAAAGDAAANHRLGALISCPEPPSTTLQ